MAVCVCVVWGEVWTRPIEMEDGMFWINPWFFSLVCALKTSRGVVQSLLGWSGVSAITSDGLTAIICLVGFGNNSLIE